MTVKREYHCDLCRDRIPDYMAGIGVKWVAYNHIRNVLISDSEHHLCNPCCGALREMFAEMDKMERERQARDTPDSAEARG